MDDKEKNTHELYENGKGRRYNLLFAVNGGAFAIVLAISDKTKNLGGLSIEPLAIGMVLFIAVMFIDIFSFGFKYRGIEPGTAFYNLFTFETVETGDARNPSIFGFWGQLVLTLLCLLLCIGWFMIAFHAQCQCK